MSMKTGKAPAVDCFTVELLKADITKTIDLLHDLFCEIWVSETVPADWRKGLIVKIAKKGISPSVETGRGLLWCLSLQKWWARYWSEEYQVVLMQS